MTSKDAVAILVNDIHLDKGNGNLVKDIFRQLIQVCRDFDVENIICGGDIFTNRSAQPMLCLTDWKDILATFLGCLVPVITNLFGSILYVLSN